MATLFSFLFLAALALFIIGLFSPNTSLWYLKTEKTKSKSRKYYGLSMLAAFIMVAVTMPKNASSASLTPSVEVKEAEIEITSVNLVEQYEQNEVKADRQFKGKTLVVQGVITKIHKDITGSPYVILKSSNLIRNVQCFIDENTAVQLQINDKVAMQGTCDGLMMNVILNDCKLHPMK